jgi:hypothetical protein
MLNAVLYVLLLVPITITHFFFSSDLPEISHTPQTPKAESLAAGASKGLKVPALPTGAGASTEPQVVGVAEEIATPPTSRGAAAPSRSQIATAPAKIGGPSELLATSVGLEAHKPLQAASLPLAPRVLHLPSWAASPFPAPAAVGGGVWPCLGHTTPLYRVLSTESAQSAHFRRLNSLRLPYNALLAQSG